MTPIDSKWTKITAKWTNNIYTDHHEEAVVDQPQVYMRLERRPDERGNIKEVLHFFGGLGRHELYFVNDIISEIKACNEETFCAWRGTIDPWFRCEVPIDQILKFLEQEVPQYDWSWIYHRPRFRYQYIPE